MYLQLVLAGLSLAGGVEKIDCENLYDVPSVSGPSRIPFQPSLLSRRAHMVQCNP
jgi:hypothetical protein